jgi:magnesium transporter
MQKWMLIHEDKVEAGDASLFPVWKKNPACLLWVNIEGPADSADQKLLVEMLGLPEAEVKVALRDRHPPSFSGEQDFLFLLLKPLDSDSKTLDFNTQQMAIFGGKNFVITRHNKNSTYLDTLWSAEVEGKSTVKSSYQMFALLSQRMVDRYGRVLLDLEERLDSLEDELMQDLDETHMQELVGYNTALRKMRRILKYHVTVTDQLRHYADRSDLKEWADEYEDISAQAERFNSLAELYQNVINDLIDGYISLNAHHLNQVMKVLTVVTVVFLPLSLLVGVYGMNFEYMPELKAQNGYYILISVMIGIASALALIFRRLKWL